MIWQRRFDELGDLTAVVWTAKGLGVWSTPDIIGWLNTVKCIFSAQVDMMQMRLASEGNESRSLTMVSMILSVDLCPAARLTIITHENCFAVQPAARSKCKALMYSVACLVDGVKTKYGFFWSGILFYVEDTSVLDIYRKVALLCT